MSGRYRYRRRAPVRSLPAVAAVVLLGLAGCDGGAVPGPPNEQEPIAEAGLGDAQPSAEAAPAHAVPAELQGTWSLDVYCASTGHLDERGFGRIAERPAASGPSTSGGRPTAPTAMTLTLYPAYFEISWPRADGTWQVGWSGPATVEEDTLHLDHKYADGIRDSFTWSRHGRRLALRYPATGGAGASGIPGQSSSVAYFSLPWTAVDCPPHHVAALR